MCQRLEIISNQVWRHPSLRAAGFEWGKKGQKLKNTQVHVFDLRKQKEWAKEEKTKTGEELEPEEKNEVCCMLNAIL